MSSIRKKGIITTIIIYFGFLLGALNIFFYFKFFRTDYTGLTRVLLDIAVLLSSWAMLGTNSVVTKFYPYYRDYHKKSKSELLTIAFFFSGMACLLLLIISPLTEPLIMRKFIIKAPLLVNYFYLIYPLTFFLVFFQVLEAQTWNLHKAVLSNFLKEVAVRLFNTALILLFIAKLVSFHTYVLLFSWQYAFIFFVLLIYLMYRKELNMSFKISSLTRRIWNKMLPYAAFILVGNVISMFSSTIDSIIIASFLGLDYAAVFMIGQYIVSIIIVPQRTASSISSPIISQAWKDKDMAKLGSIYHKTSLNLLIAASFIFTIIWINYDDAFRIVNPAPIYLLSKPILLLLGICQIIELGTGMNSAIIILSRRWKFEMYSNMILLICTIPITYFLIKYFGMIGAAWATLLSRTIFNGIRYVFLKRVYNLQPFTWKTLIAAVLPIVVFLLVNYTINLSNPFLNIAVRSIIFTGIYAFLLLQLKVSEDVQQVYGTIRKRVTNLFR
jgi:O-antigen/teichoic acid export membrane protein